MDLISLITLYPAYSIVVLSGLVTLISSLVTKWLTNQEHLKNMKERQKQVQKDLKTCKPGDKLFEELQAELIQISMTMMKSSFKPLLVTFVPFILLLNWIRNVYTPILPGWLWYYIISSIAFSLIYRKLLKMA